MVFITGSNTVLQIGNSKIVKEIFRNLDLFIDHDVQFSDTTAFANVILPDLPYLERMDLSLPGPFTPFPAISVRFPWYYEEYMQRIQHGEKLGELDKKYRSRDGTTIFEVLLMTARRLQQLGVKARDGTDWAQNMPVGMITEEGIFPITNLRAFINATFRRIRIIDENGQIRAPTVGDVYKMGGYMVLVPTGRMEVVLDERWSQALGILVSELLKPPTAGMLVLPLLNPNANLSSWMVWGASGVSLLILFSLLFTAPLIKPFDKKAVWGRDRRVMNALGLLMSAFGVFVALYTGLVLPYERGIPFWHSAAVPLLALFMGVAAGSGLYGLLGRVETGKWIAFSSGLAALTYLIHLHLSLIGPAAAAFSAQGAMSDPAALGGVALTLAAAAVAIFGRGRPSVAVAGALAIVAVFLIRMSLLLRGAWTFPNF